SDAASTLGPRVIVKCVECNHSRSIHEASGSGGWENLPLCRGRHPHLQQFAPSCGKPLKLTVLGASNLWLAVSASALHLPTGQTVEDLVAAHWDVLGALPYASVAQAIIEGMDALRGLRVFPIEEVWGCVEKIRGTGGPAAAGEASEDLRDAEWQLLSRPTTERQDADFRAVPTPPPSGYDRLIDQVVLVSRLREVSRVPAVGVRPEHHRVRGVPERPQSTACTRQASCDGSRRERLSGGGARMPCRGRPRHHVGEAGVRKGTPSPWAALMAKMRRKTLIVCAACHDWIHANPVAHAA
ncbi:MAG TPA: hypothetical protein VI194_11775, partial [Mycobacterium sp.]